MADSLCGLLCLDVVPLGFLDVAFVMALISVVAGDVGKANEPWPPNEFLADLVGNFLPAEALKAFFLRRKSSDDFSRFLETPICFEISTVLYHVCAILVSIEVDKANCNSISFESSGSTDLSAGQR